MTWNKAIRTTLRKYLQGKQKRDFVIRELYTKDFIKKLYKCYGSNKNNFIEEKISQILGIYVEKKIIKKTKIGCYI